MQIIKTLLFANLLPYLLLSGQVTAVGPHLIFTCLALLTLLSFKHFLRTKKNSYWYLCCILSAFALTSLEYAALLLITIISFLYIKRNSGIEFSSRMLLRGLLLFISSAAIIWPAGVLKLKIFVSYAKYTYVALFSDYYRSFSDSLLYSSVGHLSITLLILLATFTFFSCKQLRDNLVLQIFFAYGLLLLCLNLPNHLIYPQYLFSFTPILLISSAIVFSNIFNGSIVYKAGIILILSLVSFLNFYDLERTTTERIRVEEMQRRNLTSISKGISNFNTVTFVGYGNYVSKRSLKYSGDISILNPDISSKNEFLSHIRDPRIQALVYFKNAPRVFNKIAIMELRQVISDNFLLTEAGSDFEIYSKKS